MKFGVREICDVVLRAKAAQKIGDKVFYKDEPVLYFDSLKTSTLEGAATTVYAQGGKGNARLVAWEGERTVTFTMEDALISPMGFSILTGAGLVDAKEKPVIIHKTEQVQVDSATATEVKITLSEKPYGAQELGEGVEATDFEEGVQYYTKNEENVYTPVTVTESTFNSSSTTYYTRAIEYKIDDNMDYIYIMRLDDNGDIVSEPYIASEKNADIQKDELTGKWTIKLYALESNDGKSDKTTGVNSTATNRKNDLTDFDNSTIVLVDYYVEKTDGAFQINITPDKFGGNFYLEASTLFRATNGVDMPAEFIIPNCKIQSNFNFTMASSGDPSTFTFTMDAFPDYTRWNKSKKVFAAIQVLEQSDKLTDFERLGTPHTYGKDTPNGGNSHSEPYATYVTDQQASIEN